MKYGYIFLTNTVSEAEILPFDREERCAAYFSDNARGATIFSRGTTVAMPPEVMMLSSLP